MALLTKESFGSFTVFVTVWMYGERERPMSRTSHPYWLKQGWTILVGFNGLEGSSFILDKLLFFFGYLFPLIERVRGREYVTSDS